jgi:hypothetical protein
MGMFTGIFANINLFSAPFFRTVSRFGCYVNIKIIGVNQITVFPG